ncbi:hypothetical protein FOZ60_001374 [Perkinsus olseni]|uniref:Uncharacterized protein n=2 Tax=Perkinsus olseni TaxID=32597 RepID=A0A7J6PJF7_PEROL|nr:hypothetical protein FOZ60_001374 [Perkinsus olseni]
MEIRITDSTVETGSIKCPRTDPFPVFITKYHGRRALKTYEFVNNSVAYNRQNVATGSFCLHDFGDHTPPEASGLDPLRELNQAAFRGERETLFAAIGEVEFPPKLPILSEGYFRYWWGREFKTEVAERAIGYTEAVCLAVQRAMKKQLGTFVQVCGKFYRESEGAIAAARRADWVFNTSALDVPWKGTLTKGNRFIIVALFGVLRLVSLMSTRPFIIGASTAALLFNLPVSYSIGSLASDSPSDDYPPLFHAVFDSRDDSVSCMFVDISLPQVDTMQRALTFRVKNSSVETSTIECPRTDLFPVFKATYNNRFALETYKFVNTSVPYDSSNIQTASWCTYDFGDRLPLNNTGLDPLRELNSAGFRDEEAGLLAAVHEVEFPPGFPVLAGNFLLLWDKKFKTRAADAAVSRTETFCSTVLKAIDDDHGTFEQLCGEFFEVSEEAVVAGKPEKRLFDTNNDSSSWERAAFELSSDSVNLFFIRNYCLIEHLEEAPVFPTVHE